MDRTPLPHTSEAEIADAVSLYGSDGAFWRFVEDFSATVGFDMRSNDEATTARLIKECARQFAFLRDEFPAYFKALSERRGDTLAVLAHVAEWAVVSGVSRRHFSAAGPSVFMDAYDERRRHHDEQGVEAVRREAVAEEERLASERQAPSEQMAAVADIMLDAAVLKRSARKLYDEMVGRIVKVSDYRLEGGDSRTGSRLSERVDGTELCYELAFLDKTGADEIGYEAGRGEIASRWSLVMMTGQHRGERASVAAPSFHPDGMITEEGILLDYLSKRNLVEDLDDRDLAELARLDLADAAGTELEVSAATVYVGETDHQDTARFDPPIQAVGDDYDPADFDASHRIDSYDSRDRTRIVDLFIDFSSDAAEMEGLRSAWAHGASYISDGRVDLGETGVPRVFAAARIDISPEAFIARKKAGDFEARAAASIIPVDGFALPEGPADSTALEARAIGFYHANLGRLVKVTSYFIDGVDTDGFGHAQIGLVDMGGDGHVGLTNPGGRVAESVWPLMIMTGPHRGMGAWATAPYFHADGTARGGTIIVDNHDSYIRPSRLSDEDLVNLARHDMIDYAERPLNVSHLQAFIIGTDETTELAFDPPLEAVVHPIDDLSSLDKACELGGWDSSGLAEIRYTLDIETADDRMDGFRAPWTTGVNYTSHGLMIFGSTEALPFIPEFVARSGSVTSTEPLPSPGA